MRKRELTRDDRVASADLAEAFLNSMKAKDELRKAEEAFQRTNAEVELVDARFGMGDYGRYGRRWQNPFYVPAWRSFWLTAYGYFEVHFS